MDTTTPVSPFMSVKKSEPADRELVADILAGNQEALETLDKHRNTDVVILDVKMPGMDGIETLKEIKKSNIPARVSADIASSYIAPVPTTPPVLGYAEPPADNERYAAFTDNPVKSTAVDPMSTFGVDVDTASYAISRQGLNHGSLPRPDSVRTEEWLNYFSYDYPSPTGLDQPFSVYTEVAPAPWNADKHLLALSSTASHRRPR